MKLQDFQACAIAAVRSDANLRLIPRGTFKTYVSFDVQSDETVVGAIMRKVPDLVLIRFSGRGKSPPFGTQEKLNDIAAALHRRMGTNCPSAG